MVVQVDILMATYQGSKFILEQIKSIQNQSHKNWRLIINDDDSTDGTREILTELSQQPNSSIVLLPKNERLGVVGNFSYLMQHSTSPYIMFSDQDDYWYPDKIAITLKKMKKLEEEHGTTKPLLVHTDLSVVDSQLKEVHPSFWKYSHFNCKSFVTLNRILTQNVVTGCTMLFNRPLLELAQPVPREAFMHDWWLALVAAAFGQIGIVSEPTIAYRQHGRNQLGAQAYSLAWLLTNPLSFFQKHKKKQQVKQVAYLQASHFLDRYANRIDPYQKNMLNGYRDYCIGNFWKKRKALFKYSFYKNGFSRNVYELLF